MEELLIQKRAGTVKKKTKTELMELPESKRSEFVPWFMCSACGRAFTDMDKMFDHKYSVHPEFAKLIDPPQRQRQKPKPRSRSSKQSTDDNSSTSGAGTSKQAGKVSAAQDSALPRSKPCPKSKKPKALSSNLDDIPRKEPRKKPKLDHACPTTPSCPDGLLNSVTQNNRELKQRDAFDVMRSASQTISENKKASENMKEQMKAAANKAPGSQEQNEVTANKLTCFHCYKLFDTKDLLAQHRMLVHQFVVTKDGSNTSESLMKPCELCGRNLAPPFKCDDCPNKQIVIHHPKIKQEPVDQEENAENVDTDKPINGKRRLRSSSLPDHSRSKVKKMDPSEVHDNVNITSLPDNQPPQPRTPEKHVLSSSMVSQNEEQRKPLKPKRSSRMSILGSPRPQRSAYLHRRSLNVAPVTIVPDVKKSPPSFACRICGKSFNSESNLITHERAHQLNESSQSFASTPIPILID